MPLKPPLSVWCANERHNTSEVKLLSISKLQGALIGPIWLQLDRNLDFAKVHAPCKYCVCDSLFMNSLFKEARISLEFNKRSHSVSMKIQHKHSYLMKFSLIFCPDSFLEGNFSHFQSSTVVLLFFFFGKIDEWMQQQHMKAQQNE